MKIALALNGTFICAENGGDDAGIVHGNRSQIGAWEIWTVERQASGALALKTSGGRYLSAEEAGGGDVHANRPAVGAWEQFQVIGEIAPGARIALKTCDEQHFLAVATDADRTLHARSGTPVFFTVELLEADQPPAIPAGPLSAIHVDGIDFRDASNARVVFCEVTNFMQFYRFVRSEDLAPTLYPGFDLDRVTLTMKWIPEQLGLPVLNLPLPQLQTSLAAYLTWKRSIGRRSELTVLCDMHDMGIDTAQQIRILNAVYEVAQDYRDMCLVEFGNEVLDGENRLDLPALIAGVDRHGVVSSSGSGTTGDAVPEPYLDYCTPHLIRSSLTKMMADGNFGEQVYGSWTSHPTPTHRPMLTNEMKGAGESDSDSRYTDPVIALECARIFASRNGGCFHATDAVYSRPLGPKQEICRAAFVRGLHGA